jgi:hypothetical protein
VARSTIELRFAVSYAWWLAPYLNSLIALKSIAGVEPNMKKVSAVIKRGIKVEVLRG